MLAVMDLPGFVAQSMSVNFMQKIKINSDIFFHVYRSDLCENLELFMVFSVKRHSRMLISYIALQLSGSIVSL
jgi:hypothetical protein